MIYQTSPHLPFRPGQQPATEGISEDGSNRTSHVSVGHKPWKNCRLYVPMLPLEQLSTTTMSPMQCSSKTNSFHRHHHRNLACFFPFLGPTWYSNVVQFFALPNSKRVKIVNECHLVVIGFMLGKVTALRRP